MGWDFNNLNHTSTSSNTSGYPVGYSNGVTSAEDGFAIHPKPELAYTDIYNESVKQMKKHQNQLNQFKSKPEHRETSETNLVRLMEVSWEESFACVPELNLRFETSSLGYSNNKELGKAVEDFLNQWFLHFGEYTSEDYFNNTRSNTDMKIKDVQILAENKVVRVVFGDGETQKAVCNELDEFSLERAIEICICKYYMGGTANFNNAVRKGLKVYDDKLKAEEEEKKEKERIEKKREKHNTYRAKCRAKAEQAEREKQIEIQKEAYLQAMREYKKEKKIKNVTK